MIIHYTSPFSANFSCISALSTIPKVYDLYAQDQDVFRILIFFQRDDGLNFRFSNCIALRCISNAWLVATWFSAFAARLSSGWTISQQYATTRPSEDYFTGSNLLLPSINFSAFRLCLTADLPRLHVRIRRVIIPSEEVRQYAWFSCCTGACQYHFEEKSLSNFRKAATFDHPHCFNANQSLKLLKQCWNPKRKADVSDCRFLACSIISNPPQ